jgi:hypothetical protein
MARVCESCKVVITDGDYFEVWLTPKDPKGNPEQDAESYSGDYCRECVVSGKAGADLLATYDSEVAEDVKAAFPSE